MGYSLVEVDLSRCSLSTIIELWLYSKPRPSKHAEELKSLCKKESEK